MKSGQRSPEAAARNRFHSKHYEIGRKKARSQGLDYEAEIKMGQKVAAKAMKTWVWDGK